MILNQRKEAETALRPSGQSENATRMASFSHPENSLRMKAAPPLLQARNGFQAPSFRGTVT
ncbi:hypothetical protein Amal_01886 [Acetobacter malorum]|uniref:Uncharacterized protein n=1 Tax=Acetobacter malorum TaxID=178901 RepID=A0A177G9S5_9PROT|nr:hypothetical protein Amal_01886 [Acetobacter malorum]